MQVLYEQNPDEKLAPASITKVMTLLLVMEAIDNGQLSYEDTVSCSDYASSMGGSQIWLEPGEQMTVHELLKATAVASANDAAVALAEKIAGTEAAFVDKMNKKAHELGLSLIHIFCASSAPSRAAIGLPQRLGSPLVRSKYSWKVSQQWR